MSRNDATLKAELRSLPSLKGPFPETTLAALPPSPVAAFSIWLREAIKHGISEPHAMTLSTVGEDGYPDARVLILKNVDERGWHFAVKADSPKGMQIEKNSGVALTFYWTALGRQVRIRGQAIKLPEAESAADFLDRPLASRASAMATRQSQRLDDQEELRRSLVGANKRVQENPGYVSPTWTVYAVQPKVVEFWQGASDRVHQRLRFYQSTDGVWTREHLWP